MRRLNVFLLLMILGFTPVLAQDNQPTIADLIKSNAKLTQLAAAINLADPVVLETLNDPAAELTIYAPTDQAFQTFANALPQSDSIEHIITEKDTLDAVLEDKALLTEVLLNHITQGKIDLMALVERLRGNSTREITLNNDLIYISATFDSGGHMVTNEGIRLNGEFHVDLNVMGIEASNGVIYLIDGVLLPETRTIARIIADNAADPDYPDFIILTKILEAADPAILELLADPAADVTLFTPIDAAFDSLSPQELASLTQDSAQATAFLNRYISPDLVYGFNLFPKMNADGTLEIKMMDGSVAIITLPEERFYGEFNFNGAFVGLPDTVAKNGLIQYLDNLPVPAGEG